MKQKYLIEISMRISDIRKEEMEAEEKVWSQIVHMRNKSLIYSINREKQNVTRQFLATTFHLLALTHGGMGDVIVYKVFNMALDIITVIDEEIHGRSLESPLRTHNYLPPAMTLVQ